jgi:hypothetical protein
MNRTPFKKALVALLAAAPIVMISAVALSNGKHAALAYNDSKHVYGFAKDQGSKEAADKMALGFCGEGCTIRLDWDSGCGAYAQGQANIHYGWAVGASKNEAESKAVAACTHDGGKNCSLREWGCE